MQSLDQEKLKFGKELCEYLLSIKKHSNQSDVHCFYAQFLLRLVELENCEKHCLKAIKLDDKNINGYIAYAQYLQHPRIENFSKAEAQYKKALKLNEKHNNLLYYYAEFLHECLDKMSEAMKLFDQMDPNVLNNSSPMLLSKALAVFKLNRFHDFLVISDRVLEIGPLPQQQGIDQLRFFAKKAIENNDDFGALMDTSDVNQCIDAWYEAPESEGGIDVLINFMNKFEIPFDKFVQFIQEKNEDINGKNNKNKSKVSKEEKARFELKKQECIRYCNQIERLYNALGGSMGAGADVADSGAPSTPKTKGRNKSRAKTTEKVKGGSKKKQLENLLPQRENINDVIDELKQAGGSGGSPTQSIKKKGKNKASKKEETIKNMSKFENLHNSWMKETSKIVNLSNSNNGQLDLSKYHENMQLIDNQRKILHTQWQEKMQQFTKQSIDTTVSLHSFIFVFLFAFVVLFFLFLFFMFFFGNGSFFCVENTQRPWSDLMFTTIDFIIFRFCPFGAGRLWYYIPFVCFFVFVFNTIATIASHK